MPGEERGAYPQYRLGEAGVSLFDCEHSTPKPTPFGYPYIAIPDIQYGRLDLSQVRRISQDDFEKWTRKTKPQPGDIIVTRRGRVGDTAPVPPGLDCAIGQNLVILRSNGSLVDQAYLRWALRGPLYEQQLRKYLNVGAVFDSLNCADIPKFVIPVPPLPEQRTISHILGTLDSKIELNRRMNETLEAIARVLFKSWFVDFDPVRAKAEGRQPVGMDAETAALFSSELVHSEVGALPRGWAVGSVEVVATLTRRGLNPGEYPNELFDHYSIPAFNEGRMPKVELGEQIKSNKFLVPTNAVLLSKINPHIPRVWLPTVGGDRRSVCSTEYLVLQPASGIRREYLYAMCASRSFLDLFTTLVTGTSGSHQRVQADQLLKMRTVVPPTAVVARFTETVAAMYKRVAANVQESVTLAAIRDSLLPKLLSGQIRVQDAETLVGAAV